MALNNVSEVVSALPSDMISRIDFLITVFQAAGWVIIFYLVFNIINTVINRRRNKKLDELLLDIKEIKKALTKKR